LIEIAKERQSMQGHGCLVYSFGSNGDFKFEESVAGLLSDNGKNDGALSPTSVCDVHVFDMDDYSADVPAKYRDIIHFHKWGIKASSTSSAETEKEVPQEESQENSTNDEQATATTAKTADPVHVYHTFQETIDLLGHNDRVVDVLKVDCEGCEWHTYADWLAADVDIRQIQVEVHRAPEPAIPFFLTLQDEGYVTFHKEANTMALGICYEYAFMKLKHSFFDEDSSQK
jgi:hypothetical protein